MIRLSALILTLLVAGPAADSPVADAAQRRDVEAVRSLLRDGADVNAAQNDGMSALHWAAQNDDGAVIEVLLYAGANTAATTRLGGYTALHLAGRAGNAEALDALLTGGADADAVTTTGVTALHFAAAAGRTDAVETLIRHGASIDVGTETEEQTPLMWATASNRLDAMRTLLDAGADPALTTAVVDYVQIASRDMPQRRLRAQLASVRRNADRPGTSPAQARSGAGQLQAPSPEDEPEEEGEGEQEGEQEDEGEQLPEEEPTEEERPLGYNDLIGKEGGFTALHFAARDGLLEATQLLLAHGSELDQPTAGDGTTPMLMATINGHFDLAMHLLEEGADPNATAEDGAAPLFTVLNRRWSPKAAYPQPQAFRQQHTDYLTFMTALMEAGADVNHRTGRHIWYTSFNFDMLGVNFAGATAFWRAAYATDLDAMRLLVEWGADPSMPTRKVPVRRFRRSNTEDQSGLPPVPTGGPGVYPIHAASGVGYGEGFAANQHSHAPDSWLPAIRYLVEEHGADVNARDLNGYSAVHHAASRGDNELIQYLVEQGADVTVVSRRGETTVDMANGPRQRVQPFPETIALLESLGAINNHNCQSCE
ncbi:MAG: ankyrin repeat domain-containing protein [Gemmatimonadota bacterium]|nr:ankyrin repeat domain-containing protein [Gemmatimonadota bacterium]MDE3005646.1 ankyrin repeat domain-containing protein [Gemmatimonadota bacterium]MDE3015122.1 ankyrin repeat domain-containing protein [Gemmatimonadota bacterium]